VNQWRLDVSQPLGLWIFVPPGLYQWWLLFLLTFRAIEFFLPFLLLSFLVFSGKNYTSSWLKGVVVRGVSSAKVLPGRAKFGDIFGARFVVFG
jgi:hypothetical protein